MKHGNITLIGMAGVGKSTIGKALAKATGKHFVDLDPLIESTHGMTLQQIIDTKGLEAFKEIEANIVYTLGNEVSNTIISPGGSIVYYDVAMDWIKQYTSVVYLKDELDNIVKRIPNLHERGIVGLKEKGLQAIFDERCEKYEHFQDYTFTLQKPFNKSRIVRAMVKELNEHNIL